MSVLVDVVVMKDMDLPVNRLTRVQACRAICSTRPSMTTASVAATSRTASSSTNSARRKRSWATACIPLGCTRSADPAPSCGVTLWNNRRSWCVQAGAPCIGCCEANPNDPGHNWVEVNTPFYKRHARPAHRRLDGCSPPPSPLIITGIVAGGARGARLRHEDHRPHGRRRGLREDARLGCQASRQVHRHLRGAEAERQTAVQKNGTTTPSNQGRR